MKIDRQVIRKMIMQEIASNAQQNNSRSRRRMKRMNEGLGLAMIAGASFAVLAIAGVLGLEYVIVSDRLDELIQSDPRVQQKLEKLDQMVVNNPDMSPTEIASEAAKTDSELAMIIDELSRKVSSERRDAYDMMDNDWRPRY